MRVRRGNSGQTLLPARRHCLQFFCGIRIYNTYVPQQCMVYYYCNSMPRKSVTMRGRERGGCLRIKVVLLTVLGFLFLGLGAIGLLFPVWPTTPFVLVAAACFSGTPYLRKKIMQIGFFREHIENYENRNGLSQKTITISLVYLWGMLLLSALLVRKLWLVLLLAVVGIAVTAHLLYMAKGKTGAEKPEE